MPRPGAFCWHAEADAPLRAMRAEGRPFHAIADRLSCSTTAAKVRAHHIGVGLLKDATGQACLERAQAPRPMFARLQAERLLHHHLGHDQSTHDGRAH